MKHWLDNEFNLGLLRRLAAGHRLADTQLEHLEDSGLVTDTGDGVTITRDGIALLNHHEEVTE